jgi:site-specific recombinase XerD
MNNNKTIEDFINFKIVNMEINEESEIHYRRVLKALNKDINKKSFRNATESDIQNHLSHYAPSTRNTRIPMIKVFYRWLYNLDEYDKPPECVRRIKKSKKASNKDEINYRERTITEIEYDRIIDFTPRLVQKAITETFYNFGTRLSELHSMKSQDVKYEEGITKITIRESKTKTRDIIYEGRSEYLLKYYETYYPYKNQKNKPLWVFGKQNKPYTKSGIERFIGRISKRAINEYKTPHDFRHTSVTNARANNVPLPHIESNYGYTHGSSMMKIYDHNKTKDYEEWLRKRTKKIEPSFTVQKKLYEKVTIKQQKQINELKEKIEILEKNVMPIDNDEKVKKHIYQVLKEMQKK